MDRSKELNVLRFAAARNANSVVISLGPNKKKTNKQQPRLLYSNVWTVERLRVRFDDWFTLLGRFSDVGIHKGTQLLVHY